MKGRRTNLLVPLLNSSIDLRQIAAEPSYWLENGMPIRSILWTQPVIRPSDKSAFPPDRWSNKRGWKVEWKVTNKIPPNAAIEIVNCTFVGVTGHSTLGLKTGSGVEEIKGLG
jgi:hypothetical protein